MKCLFYGETPVIETGAAHISQHLTKLMKELGWAIEVVGINHFGDVPYDHEEYPFTFYNAPEGQFYNVANAKEQIAKGDYDLLYLTGDINHVYEVLEGALEAREKFHFPIIALVVIDIDFDMPYLPMFSKVDQLAVYSKFAHEVVCRRQPDLKEKLHCTTLGCEPDAYYPLTAEQRRKVRAEAFHIESDDTFLVTCVNRNQYRKDLMRGAYAFHLFHQQHPDSKMYIHAKMNDLGGDLPTQAHLLGMKLGEPGEENELIFTQPEYTVIRGFPREVLNQVYNAADVCVSTSQGEGWGLTTSESMAAGTPFIGPRHTTFIELLGEGEERGYFAKCGGPDLWNIHYGRGEEPRPITSCTDLARVLEHVYIHREEAKEKAGRARVWAESHTWKVFVEQWREILLQVAGAVAA